MENVLRINTVSEHGKFYWYDLIHGTPLGKHIADYTFSLMSPVKHYIYQKRN